MHIILATHGNLAESYIETGAMISGKDMMKGVYCVCMEETTSVEQFMEEATSLLHRDEAGQYLILADLLGASPCNCMIASFRNADYRIITGLNLGMLLEALYMKDRNDLEEVASELEEKSKNGIKKVFLHI